MILRACEDIYPESFLTSIGTDFKSAIQKIDDRSVKIQLWDQVKERFSSGVYSAMPGIPDIIVVTAPLDNRKNFEAVSSFLEEVNKYKRDNTQVMLIGTKCQSTERQVEEEELQALAEKYNVPYTKIDAKSGHGIEGMMNKLATMHVGNKLQEKNRNEGNSTTRPIVTKQDKKGLFSIFSKFSSSSKGSSTSNPLAAENHKPSKKDRPKH